MNATRLTILLTLLPVAGPPLHARLLHRRSSSITLRRRLHVNTLITEPGTLETEWNHAYSNSGGYSMPSTIKYTPEGRDILWGRTEYSVSFDGISSQAINSNRITQFSDRVTFTANSVVFDGEKLDVAIAPQASVFLRDEEGARIGASAIARYDWGRNSAGLSLTWTGATVASSTNPAGTFDAGLGFGRRLAASGFWGHLTPHGNVLWEKSTGVNRLTSLFEGMEYQITEKLALDVSGQHLNLGGGAVDHQIVAGLTMNWGRLGRKALKRP